jgi:glycosyltransferase involved in cell wall biosynthesis
MRILEVGKFFPPPFGGMETVLHSMVKEFSKEDDVEVVVANDKPGMESANLGKSRIHKVGAYGTFAGTSICPSMPFTLRRLFRENPYDIVHVHLPNPTGHLSLEFSMPRSSKLVVTWHSDIVRQKRLMKIYSPLLSRLLDRASAIVAATPKNFSSSTQLDLERFSGKMHAIPFGIDIDFYRETEAIRGKKGEIRNRYGNKIIFACGRHIYYKGFEFLIQAISRLEGAVLLLGGRGPLSESLEALARDCGCADRVHFLGYVAEADIASYYHSSDIVCMPSVDLSEAFGMVQLEAMACGKPVVCCELGNGVTYVNLPGVTGLAVSPRDPEALADAIRTLLEDSGLRDKMGRAGYDRVRREFSLETMRMRYSSLFRSIVHGEGTPLDTLMPG